MAVTRHANYTSMVLSLSSHCKLGFFRQSPSLKQQNVNLEKTKTCFLGLKRFFCSKNWFSVDHVEKLDWNWWKLERRKKFSVQKLELDLSGWAVFVKTDKNFKMEKTFLFRFWWNIFAFKLFSSRFVCFVKNRFDER